MAVGTAVVVNGTVVADRVVVVTNEVQVDRAVILDRMVVVDRELEDRCMAAGSDAVKGSGAGVRSGMQHEEAAGKVELEFETTFSCKPSRAPNS